MFKEKLRNEKERISSSTTPKTIQFSASNKTIITVTEAVEEQPVIKVLDTRSKL